MKRYFSSAGIITAGLLVSQIFFTIFVYKSNFTLLKKLEAISEAGYLAVPNTHIMSGLDGFLPAFCGGLFFTLTVGAGLTLGVFILVYIWHSILGRRPEILLLAVMIWELGIYKSFETESPVILPAVFLLVPLVVAALTFKWMPGQRRRSEWKSIVTHVVVLLIIAGTWVPNINADVFVNIRDQVLLSNPAGRVINSFYYRYTLYPAEAFKSLHQKQLKTARIQVDAPELSNRLEKTLRRLDYLPVDADTPMDLTVSSKGSQLLLAHQSQTVRRVTTSRFFGAPRSTLKNFSDQTDQMQFLRQFTFFSLILAAPLLLYFLIHLLFSTGLFMIRSPGIRTLCAAVICVIVGVGIAAALYRFQHESNAPQSSEAIRRLLQSNAWRDRVTALKRIDAEDIDIAAHASVLGELRESPYTAERYWTAKALDNSDSEKTYRMLTRLLHDPHPNVVCMALYSLGNRNDPRAVGKIRKIVISSDHWYIQWYAYNALKELGWIQPKSV